MSSATQTAIARFAPLRALSLAAAIIGVTAWAVTEPILENQTYSAYVKSASNPIWWMLACVGGLYCSFYVAVMATRVILFRNIAIYIQDGRLVFEYPFIMSIRLADIAKVEVDTGKWPSPLNVDRGVLLTLTNGKQRRMKSALLVESEDVIMERVARYI